MSKFREEGVKGVKVKMFGRERYGEERSTTGQVCL